MSRRSIHRDAGRVAGYIVKSDADDGARVVAIVALIASGGNPTTAALHAVSVAERQGPTVTGTWSLEASELLVNYLTSGRATEAEGVDR